MYTPPQSSLVTVESLKIINILIVYIKGRDKRCNKNNVNQRLHLVACLTCGSGVSSDVFTDIHHLCLHSKPHLS